MPAQPYCSHPPHSTLIFGDYGLIDAWKAALADRLKTFPAVEWSTDAWHVFPDDAMAGGGQTVALRGTNTPAIFALQRAVAEILGPFHRAQIEEHALGAREPFASSLRQFGFPFVGAHWLPHFTIGSPRVGPGSPIVAELQSGSPAHSFSVKAIGLWEVRGEHHARIETLPLGRA
jgi:hypothetical protein